MGRKYIDAKLLKERFSKSCADFSNRNRNRVFEIFASMPAEDVAPVRHGAWVDNVVITGINEFTEIFAPEYQDGYKCNLCGAKSFEIRYPFCPYCGARMDGQGKEETP